jgi:hypothetical protein
MSDVWQMKLTKKEGEWSEQEISKLIDELETAVVSQDIVAKETIFINGIFDREFILETLNLSADIVKIDYPRPD